jgi:hypothetical protein
MRTKPGELYTFHNKALKDAGLCTHNSYPTLPDSLQSIQDNHASDPEISKASEGDQYCSVMATQKLGVSIVRDFSIYGIHIASSG